MTKFIKSPLNYTGGKYKLLSQITPLFPREIGTFVDLFAGGANVAVNVDANKIIASDINHYVIDIYKYFQTTDIETILHDIELSIEQYGLSIDNVEGFNAYRNDYNQKLDNPPFDKNLMLFVLICYSFNHQFRFNSKGEFNMPFGKNRSQWNKNIKNNLIQFHNIIREKQIIFLNKSFTELKCEKLTSNDFVYCDPPYLITCATYNEKDGWNETNEKQLLELLDTLNDRNVKFALSNVLFSKGKINDLLINWSKKYNVHHLDYTYQNCNYHTKDKSTKPDEVLITNY